MRLQRQESKGWSQRVNFWPSEWPHRIITYADVAAIKHIMRASGVPNVTAIDCLVKDENFWRSLSQFFQDKVNELGEVEEQWLPSNATIRKVPLYCWETEEPGDTL